MSDKPHQPIGTATMELDGTIVLDLRIPGGGMTLLRYAPDHAEYRNVLDHLGGLAPGEEKPVAPWES